MITKPTGILGTNKLSVQDDGSVDHAFVKIEFPKAKDEIEAMVVESFIGAMNTKMSQYGIKWFMSNPVQNIENGFDFTVTLPNGANAWLELMEIAPLSLFGGYDKAPPSYKPYELAQVIVGMIMKKAARYSGDIGRELHLLTYITHWGFSPSESLVYLLQYFLSHEMHPFSGVYLHVPIGAGLGDGRVLAPIHPQQMVGFDPEAHKENEVFNIDPTNWIVESQTITGKVN